MEKLINKIYENTEFIDIIKDLLENDTVKQMNNYRQHYETSCFNHCLIASYYCYKYCKKLNLDYISCSRAAMLHDLFLYDWRKRENDRKGLHAFTHPKTAYENASKLFTLNDKEADIILKHMWPVTISLPKYKESYILTLVDKYCALNESYQEIYNRFCQKKVFRYAYVFFCLLFIRL
ncbi:MAG: HD family phosphohydrolase [Clostridia bacterium]|nr:HD family phosphohydrolase [Clostridia bacterium]